jgi:4-hydroxy-2-oxoheptanedioate aldolase
VDFVYLGAYDLSVQFGVPGEIHSPLVVSAIKSAVETCRKHECPVGLMTSDQKHMNDWAAEGVQVFLHGVDSGIIHKAFNSILHDN